MLRNLALMPARVKRTSKGTNTRIAPLFHPQTWHLPLGPAESHLPAWRADYQGMLGSMFFGDAPTLEAMMAAVAEFEKTFNATAHLDALVDQVNRKYGSNTLRYGAMGFHQQWRMRQERKSRGFTTRWEELLVVRV